MSKQKKLEVNTSDAEKITGYKSQHLNRLVKQGILTKSRYGKWDLQKLFTELYEYKLKLETEPLLEKLKTFQEQDPEYRLKKIKADEAEYDFQIKQKTLLHERDVLDFLRKFGALIVKEFEPVGRECQAKFKYLKDDVEKIDEVVKIKDKTLDAIAATNINTLLPDTMGNPAIDVIKNRKRISPKLKTKTGSKN